MKLDQIKELLNSDTYSFLRTNEQLKDRIMLLTLGGSHAYGTNVETSDLDVRGIAAEGLNNIIGLSSFEQFTNSETDTVIYAFRKMINLMLNCNPNVIEMFGCKPEQYFILSPEGKMLKDNVDLFLTKKAAHSFGGYAVAQLRRLENALAHDSYPEDEKKKHVAKTLNNMMDHFERHYSSFGDGNYIKVYSKELIVGAPELFVDMHLTQYSMKQLTSIYNEMLNTVNTYDKLNGRNKKKDELHLNKHLMHLIRLEITGKNILEGKGIQTRCDEFLDLLMSIRNGEVSYKEGFELVDKFEKEFDYAAANSDLPDQPDMKKVEELVMEINKSILKRYSI